MVADATMGRASLRQEALRVLEFDKVLGLLAGCTTSAPGRVRALALEPLADQAAVATALAEVTEAVELESRCGAIPVGAVDDLEPALRTAAHEGGLIAAEALLQVRFALEAAKACRDYFRDSGTPLLQVHATALAPLDVLRRQLVEAIGLRGEILDSASFELGEIRSELRQTRERAKTLLERMLQDSRIAAAFQDQIVTLRNGRYVVPLRSDHRGEVEGFVQDQSASGQTLFIEPVAVLPLNNRLRSLLAEEKQEEERILRRLTALVATEAEALAQNQMLLAHLDLRAASSRLARRLDACAPELADDIEVELRAARHPLLILGGDGQPRPGQVVPIDLRLGAGQQALVISGPNTGGKSVALKTLGLLLLMVRSGLHIPCDRHSRLHLFGAVYADIGDAQSIEASLSTFSGHLVRVRRILEAADADALVLLDEAGTGTDPAEGAALAMAVLDQLRQRGTRVVLTTHLNLIKAYALTQPGVDNAAVAFDPQTLEPTYGLRYGLPGASNAFAIARQLGLPLEVIAAAEGYLGSDERESGALVEELHRLRTELQAEVAELQRQSRQAKDEKKRQRQLRRRAEREAQELKRQAAEEGQTLVRRSREELERILGSARDETAVAPPVSARLKGEARQLEQNLRQQAPAAPPPGPAPQQVEVGEILKIPALGTEGVVLRVDGKQVELEVAGKRMRLALAQLQALPRKRFAAAGEARVRGRIERDGFAPTLKIIGQRLDDALPLVERFLDDALLKGVRQVEIVHGSGEGILRRAVRELVGRHPEVEAFYAAPAEQGGDNVTVVELRYG